MQQGKRMGVGLMLPLGMGALGDGGKVPWATIHEMATLAEAAGVESLVVPDHLLFRPSPLSNNPAVDMAEGRSRGTWEAWTILGAVSAITRRVSLSPYVACTAFRNPALLAKPRSAVIRRGSCGVPRREWRWSTVWARRRAEALRSDPPGRGSPSATSPESASADARTHPRRSRGTSEASRPPGSSI